MICLTIDRYRILLETDGIFQLARNLEVGSVANDIVGEREAEEVVLVRYGEERGYLVFTGGGIRRDIPIDTDGYLSSRWHADAVSGVELVHNIRTVGILGAVAALLEYLYVYLAVNDGVWVVVLNLASESDGHARYRARNARRHVHLHGAEVVVIEAIDRPGGGLCDLLVRQRLNRHLCRSNEGRYAKSCNG